VSGGVGIREALLAQDGRLSRELRLLDGSGLSQSVRDELWQWAAYLAIVRGLRGATTVCRYLEVARRFLLWCQTKGLDYAQLTRGQIDEWQRDLYLARRNQASWRAQQLVAVRQFYAWREHQGIGRNCAAGVRGPEIKLRMPRKYQPRDLRAMLATTSGDDPQAVRDRAILLLLLTTGARREEAATLTLPQVQLASRTAVVRFAGKGAKEREVAIEGPVVEALRAWLLVRDQLPMVETDAVWVVVTASAGKRRQGAALSMQAIEHVVGRAARRAGLREWGVHRFRVTYATKLYDSGYDLERIRAVMGHDSIETTRRYLSVSEKRRQVRMSAQHQRELLGVEGSGLPLWAKLRERGTDDGTAPF